MKIKFRNNNKQSIIIIFIEEKLFKFKSLISLNEFFNSKIKC